MKVAVVLIMVASNLCAAQSSILGKWKTVDDNSGKEKSIVEVFTRNGQLYGKIIKIFPEPNEEQDPVCDKCPKGDNRYLKKVIGMEIIQDMVKVEEEYIHGSVLDPEVGKIYRCKIWLEGKDLQLRGYWGPFYRTQTWKRLP